MHKLKVCSVLALLGIIAMLGGSGCSTTGGHLAPQAHFVYPNSNVKILGTAKAQCSKTSVFIPPRLGLEDLKSVRDKVLSQVSGANVLVNVKEDTTWTVIPLGYFNIYMVTYKLEADAAHMEVGRQELR